MKVWMLSVEMYDKKCNYLSAISGAGAPNNDRSSRGIRRISHLNDIFGFIEDGQMNVERLTSACSYARLRQCFVVSAPLVRPQYARFLTRHLITTSESAALKRDCSDCWPPPASGEVDAMKSWRGLIWHSTPLSTLIRISNLEIWARDLRFEAPLQSSKQLAVFSRWQNVELYDIMPRQCLQPYIPVVFRRSHSEPSRCLRVPAVDVILWYINLTFSGGPHRDINRAVAKEQMAVAAFFAFVTVVHVDIADTETIKDGPLLIMQPGTVAVTLPVGSHKVVKEIGVSHLLHESYYGPIFEFVDFITRRRFSSQSRVALAYFLAHRTRRR